MKTDMKKIQIIAMCNFIILATLYTILLFNNNKCVATLTQLSNQGSRQMMGYVIKTENNKLIVIDGGTEEDTENLKKYINKNGKKVDYWFLTHVHDDHVGAFTKIVQDTDIEIDNIFVSTNELEWYEENEPKRIEFTKTFLEILQSDKIKDVINEPKIGDNIRIDDKVSAKILGIKNPEITENAGNEQSMVIKFYIGDTSLLILGDTGINSSAKLLENQKDKLKSDIVQMAHHGQNGATKELYEMIQPKICLWPTPDWLWDNNSGTGYNTGEWKTLETRKWMEELKVTRNIIEKDGDITIKVK